MWRLQYREQSSLLLEDFDCLNLFDIRFIYRLNQERALHTKQENEYQQTISSLQKKIADMIKQHTKAMDEIKRDLHQERLSAQQRVTTRPICVPEYVQVFFTLCILLNNVVLLLDRFINKWYQIRLHGNCWETTR